MRKRKAKNFDIWAQAARSSVPSVCEVTLPRLVLRFPASPFRPCGHCHGSSQYAEARKTPIPVDAQVLDPRTQRTVRESDKISSVSDFMQSNEMISQYIAMASASSPTSFRRGRPAAPALPGPEVAARCIC